MVTKLPPGIILRKKPKFGQTLEDVGLTLRKTPRRSSGGRGSSSSGAAKRAAAAKAAAAKAAAAKAAAAKAAAAKAATAKAATAKAAAAKAAAAKGKATRKKKIIISKQLRPPKRIVGPVRPPRREAGVITGDVGKRLTRLEGISAETRREGKILVNKISKLPSFKKAKKGTVKLIDVVSGGLLTERSIDTKQEKINEDIGSFNKKYGKRELTESQHQQAQKDLKSISSRENDLIKERDALASSAKSKAYGALVIGGGRRTSEEVREQIIKDKPRVKKLESESIKVEKKINNLSNKKELSFIEKLNLKRLKTIQKGNNLEISRMKEGGRMNIQALEFPLPITPAKSIPSGVTKIIFTGKQKASSGGKITTDIIFKTNKGRVGVARGVQVGEGETGTSIVLGKSGTRSIKFPLKKNKIVNIQSFSGIEKSVTKSKLMKAIVELEKTGKIPKLQAKSLKLLAKKTKAKNIRSLIKGKKWKTIKSILRRKPKVPKPLTQKQILSRAKKQFPKKTKPFGKRTRTLKKPSKPKALKPLTQKQILSRAKKQFPKKPKKKSKPFGKRTRTLRKPSKPKPLKPLTQKQILSRAKRKLPRKPKPLGKATRARRPLKKPSKPKPLKPLTQKQILDRAKKQFPKKPKKKSKPFGKRTRILKEPSKPKAQKLAKPAKDSILENIEYLEQRGIGKVSSFEGKEFIKSGKLKKAISTDEFASISNSLSRNDLSLIIGDSITKAGVKSKFIGAIKGTEKLSSSRTRLTTIQKSQYKEALEKVLSATAGTLTKAEKTKGIVKSTSLISAARLKKSATVPTAKQKPITKQEITQKQKPITKQETIRKQKPITKQETIQKQRPTTKQKSITKQRPTTKQKPITRQRPTTKQRPITRQRPITKQRPTQKQKQAIKPSKPTKPITPSRGTKIPPIPIGRSKRKRITRVGVRKRKQAYNVLARPLKKSKKGKKPKLIKVNKVPLKKARAKDLRNFVTDTSLSRTAGIKKAKGKPQNPKLKVPKGYAGKTSKKFRRHKTVKGERKPLPRGIVIERRKRLLDTSQEKKKISLRRRIKQITPKRKARRKKKSIKRRSRQR